MLGIVTQPTKKGLMESLVVIIYYLYSALKPCAYWFSVNWLDCRCRGRGAGIARALLRASCMFCLWRFWLDYIRGPIARPSYCKSCLFPSLRLLRRLWELIHTFWDAVFVLNLHGDRTATYSAILLICSPCTDFTVLLIIMNKFKLLRLLCTTVTIGYKCCRA